MKTLLKVVLLSSGLCLAGLAQASEVLEGAMKSLAKNSKAFAQAKTATEANTALTEMQKAAATAKQNKPDSLVKQPKDSVKVKQYEQKFDALTEEIEHAALNVVGSTGCLDRRSSESGRRRAHSGSEYGQVKESHSVGLK